MEDPALPEGVEALAQHLVAAPQELQRRLAQIGVVERADGDAAAQRLKVGQRLVSRQGDLWRWTAWRSPPMPPPGPRGGLPTEANRLADAEQLGERPRLGLQTMSPALGVGERLACKIVILARGRMRGFRLQRRRFRLGERTGRCLRQRSAPDHDRADGAARWRATGSRLANDRHKLISPARSQATPLSGLRRFWRHLEPRPPRCPLCSCRSTRARSEKLLKSCPC